MRLLQALTFTSLLALLAACNTVSGMGEDLQTGGATITDTARDAEQGM